jgi:hypothetical protein
MFPRQQLRSNNGAVFSVRSVQRCYKQGTWWESAELSWLEWRVVGWLESEWVSGLLMVSRKLLLQVAGSWGRGKFGNSDEGERLPPKAVTEQLIVKTWLWTLVCVCVCDIELLSVVTRCIKKPNKSDHRSKTLLKSHLYTRQNKTSENLKGQDHLRDNDVDGSINMDIRETWYDDVDWISLDQVWVQCQAFAKLELSFRISHKARISRLVEVLLAYLLKKDYSPWDYFVNVYILI